MHTKQGNLLCCDLFLMDIANGPNRGDKWKKVKVCWNPFILSFKTFPLESSPSIYFSHICISTYIPLPLWSIWVNTWFPDLTVNFRTKPFSSSLRYTPQQITYQNIPRTLLRPIRITRVFSSSWIKLPYLIVAQICVWLCKRSIYDDGFLYLMKNILLTFSLSLLASQQQA